jgi:hypothetical protein
MPAKKLAAPTAAAAAEAAAAAADPPPLPSKPAASLADAERMLDELMAWQSRQTKALHAKLVALEASQAAVQRKMALLSEVAAARGGSSAGPPLESPPSTHLVADSSDAGGGVGGGWRRATVHLGRAWAAALSGQRRLSPSVAAPPPTADFDFPEAADEAAA